MSNLMKLGKEIDRIDYFNDIYEVYVPGDCMPPVATEWRYRYSDYYYEIKVTTSTMVGERRRTAQRTYISDTTPAFVGNHVGVYNKSECRWEFHSIRGADISVVKYVRKVKYILLEADTLHPTAIRVGYHKEEPIPISSIDDYLEVSN